MITTDDVRDSADLFKPAYDDTDGVDGRVSIEVGPPPVRRHREDDCPGQGSLGHHRPRERTGEHLGDREGPPAITAVESPRNDRVCPWAPRTQRGTRRARVDPSVTDRSQEHT